MEIPTYVENISEFEYGKVEEKNCAKYLLAKSLMNLLEDWPNPPF